MLPILPDPFDALSNLEARAVLRRIRDALFRVGHDGAGGACADGGNTDAGERTCDACDAAREGGFVLDPEREQDADTLDAVACLLAEAGVVPPRGIYLSSEVAR